MRYNLNEEQKEALKWLSEQGSPVYSFKKHDPSLGTVKSLMPKRLVKIAKVITHPEFPNLSVCCFAVTRKGKRWNNKLSA